MVKRTRPQLIPGRLLAQANEPAEVDGILTRVNPEGWRALRMLALELDLPLQTHASRPSTSC